jgi:hypothetical protein
MRAAGHFRHVSQSTQPLVTVDSSERETLSQFPDLFVHPVMFLFATRLERKYYYSALRLVRNKPDNGFR